MRTRERDNQNHTQKYAFEPFKYRNQFNFVHKFNKNGNELTRASQHNNTTAQQPMKNQPSNNNNNNNKRRMCPCPWDSMPLKFGNLANFTRFTMYYGLCSMVSAVESIYTICINAVCGNPNWKLNGK